MQVTPILDAQPYDAPRHFGMRGYRLQGGEVSPFGAQVGLSVFEPGGGAELSSSSVDRAYVVVSGEIAVVVDGAETLLRECDSCFIPAGEARALRNHGVLPCVMITVIPKS
ncbi:MAG: cupin domain-containing protein [Burkholderiales bacterium]|nr:cupin domain-containing protein [Burkholderiales bacterium]MCE7876121.1 cupin domain-containing protein [Betaproteobacteria bacterium PRO3]